jgi:hypothetical protein
MADEGELWDTQEVCWDHFMSDITDTLERRCPKLGGDTLFSYCLCCEENKQPCLKIIDCWWEYFDVMSHLKEILPETVFKNLLTARPKPKINSLVELIEQARKRTGQI